MRLPCITCKHAYVRSDGSGFRSFYGCTDDDRKATHFKEDTWTYRHSCSGHEEGEPRKEADHAE